MALWATGMVMPVVSGPLVMMDAAKKTTKGKITKGKTTKGKTPKRKPKKEEGKGFFEQLGEWTQKTSMYETDPLLRKLADEKKSTAAPAPEEEEKSFFWF